MEKVEISCQGKVLQVVDADSRELSLKKCNITRIKDIQNLDKLDKLETLSLDDNAIREMHGLDSVPSLKSLSVRGTSARPGERIKVIEGIDQLIHLERLYLDDNEITTLSGLERLQNLRILTLRNNPVERADGLANQAHLVTLDLSFSNISKISGLETLTNLQSLFLSWCKIPAIEGLEETKKLGYLQLAGNKTTKLQGLDNLIRLTHLYLNRNQIPEIEGLGSLEALEILELGENRIATIKNLHHLENLKRLDLHGNQITRIEGLDNLVNLEELDLSQNSIRSVSNLGRLKKLHSLRLGSNPLPKEIRILIDSDSENGYAYNPQLFVTLCGKNDDFMQALALYNERSDDKGGAERPLQFQFSEIESKQYIDDRNRAIKRERLKYISYFTNNLALAEYYLCVGDDELARKHADEILKNEELNAFLKGKMIWNGIKLEYLGNKLSRREIEKTRGLDSTYLVANLFFGNRAATREWIDVIINANKDDPGMPFPTYLLALLLVRAYEKVASVEKLAPNAKEDRTINNQYYMREFARHLVDGRIQDARLIYQEYVDRIRKTPIGGIFSHIFLFFVIATVFKDCLNHAENKPPKYLFLD